MKSSKKLLIIAVLMALVSCEKEQNTKTGYADDSMWCCKPEKATAAADVFYIVSTNIMNSYKEDGTETYIAVLNDDEKAILAKEINYIHNSMFPEDVNFYAPYYHQVTMASLQDTTLTTADRVKLSDQVAKEVLDAFNYYMKNYNNGRPFILAGYSQGSIQAKNILTQMPEEQLQSMVAAYMMGFGINAQALASPNIRPATGATDTGVTVAFTSVANIGAKYGFINDSQICINPINWRTDTVSADFVYDGELLTAHVDTANHVVIVDGFHYENHDTQQWSINPWSKENYHNFEIYFYVPSIRQNVLDRINAMPNNAMLKFK